MANSIRILLVIATWYDYEIWQMNVTTVFLNGYIEEEIFIDQLKDFTSVGEKQKICRLQRSIYGPNKLLEAGTHTLMKDRHRRMLGLTQSSYIEKVLNRFKMENSKRAILPMIHGIKLSKKQSPKINEELKKMLDILYASAVGTIQYVIQCTKPNVTYALSVMSRYQACAEEAHWSVVMTILNFVFKLNGGVVACSKQATTADSTTEAEYIAASEAAKEVVWMKNYIQELGVVPSITESVIIFSGNNGAIP
ncbi:Retrovirus-related Pol polyprotein from transposon TNT 1-94 [Sesamum angolense]|uniref:Retrovirus-related Pol polyprotein from transposon TNT 1-94 n=1 Tax=Sesamum angolense TaxID=2727404 RepID=A0AAE1WAJ9_9LAMI|nr:Retrovirus-related Pol polyprotein from transposon TNT 1-94 [Sesamum angolense]